MCNEIENVNLIAFRVAGVSTAHIFYDITHKIGWWVMMMLYYLLD